MTLSRLLPLAVLCLGLAACAPPGGQIPPRTAGMPSASPMPPRAAPVPRQQARPSLGVLRPPPRPLEEVPATTLPPPKLVGLSEDEATGLLGRPAEEEFLPPAKVWVYQTEGCRLSVHFFPDMERGGFYALDYTADAPRDSCLGKVAAEARRKASDKS